MAESDEGSDKDGNKGLLLELERSIESLKDDVVAGLMRLTDSTVTRISLMQALLEGRLPALEARVAELEKFRQVIMKDYDQITDNLNNLTKMVKEQTKVWSELKEAYDDNLKSTTGIGGRRDN